MLGEQPVEVVATFRRPEEPSGTLEVGERWAKRSSPHLLEVADDSSFVDNDESVLPATPAVWIVKRPNLERSARHQRKTRFRFADMARSRRKGVSKETPYVAAELVRWREPSAPMPLKQSLDRNDLTERSLAEPSPAAYDIETLGFIEYLQLSSVRLRYR